MVVETFDEQYYSSLYSLAYNLIDHMVKEIQKL